MLVCTVTKELFISSPGERVCTVVEVEDNSAVEKERTATVTLSSTSPQVRTGPSSTITIWDDDGLLIALTTVILLLYS